MRRYASFSRSTTKPTLARSRGVPSRTAMAHPLPDLFYSFSGNDFCFLDSPGAKEKTQMPRAALAAAERPQEQRQQDGPLQHAPPVGAQDILASAKRTSSRTPRKRNRVYLRHKSHPGYLRMITRLVPFARVRLPRRRASVILLGHYEYIVKGEDRHAPMVWVWCDWICREAYPKNRCMRNGGDGCSDCSPGSSVRADR